jgi:hypothetical protein
VVAENLKMITVKFFLTMNTLRRFLTVLHDNYPCPFIIDGNINTNDNVIHELHRVDPLYSLKFSLQSHEPDAIIDLIQRWAPRANAEVKHIYWKNNDSLVTIYYQLRIVEVASRSNVFMDQCADYANQMGYRMERAPI